ncbi:YceI family protein [Flammeovirga agarivorans]|uniref:YceI family protein n=1 Tax=Flammeovirga agarivorans TaxID=2726742 RepID=A0A7X8SPW1_9BACT|nr:YceI family protein [Flammeovirga agarivorans]NLR94120.1 YceI family protein [Flammeovirga agarivorans]
MKNQFNVIAIAFLIALGMVACGEKKQAKEEHSHDHDHAHAGHTHSHDAVTFADGNYSVDLSKSYIRWVGSKIVGDEHYGKLSLKSGEVAVASGSMAKGSSFVIDMNSIVVEDIPADNKLNGKLKGHLEADDFFGVKKFPTAQFDIKEVKSVQKGKVEVTGDLTIKGITETITFPAQLMSHDGSIHAMADVTFDRTKYGIKYKSGSFFDGLGDKAINDEIQLEVHLFADKK